MNADTVAEQIEDLECSIRVMRALLSQAAGRLAHAETCDWNCKGCRWQGRIELYLQRYDGT